MTINSEHQQEHKHFRFYVFTHVNGDDISYVLTGDGEYTTTMDFHGAELFADVNVSRNIAEDFAKHLAFYHPDSHVDRRVVIGRVRVEVDPQYSMVVVK